MNMVLQVKENILKVILATLPQIVHSEKLSNGITTDSLKEVSKLTKNQIEYNKLLEASRNNRVMEELTKQRDARSYEISLGSLNETKRHNVATENLGKSQYKLELSKAEETRRSNIARELETNRSNVAHESETVRSNITKEKETERHNREMESNQVLSALYGLYGSQAMAGASMYNADMLAQHYAIADEENRRSNLAREKLNAKQVAIEQQRVDQQYSLGLKQLSEQSRLNSANVSVQNARNAIQSQKVANDYLLGKQNLAETVRANQARESENTRSNRAQEKIQQKSNEIRQQQNSINIFKTVADTLNNAARTFVIGGKR